MAVATPTKKIDPRSAQADELGALHMELAPWRLKLAREKALRESLRDSASAAPAGLGQTIEGARFVVELGAKGVERTVNVVKLADMVSLRCLQTLVSCSLKSLTDNAVSAKVQTAVIESHATGSRSITITEKAAA